jgi:hypothetical protein
MQERYPETTPSPHAEEGTAAHWVVETTLRGTPPAEDALAPNGVLVTDEMLEGAEDVVATIEHDLKPFGMGLGDVAVEQPVKCLSVHAECWGTPDYRAWVPSTRTPNGRPRLYVWDYKFGRTVVEAHDNPQLAAYASGCVDAMRLADTAVDIVLNIIQPRAYHRAGTVRYWAAAASDYRAVINIAAAAATEALGERPRTATGPECEYCTARHACPTLQKVGYRTVDMAGDSQPVGLPPEALGLELRTLRHAAERLNARITGLEQQVEHLISAGHFVPGWAMERGRGRTVWAQPPAQVIAVASAMGYQIAKPAAPLTPKQAVKAGMPEILVAQFTQPLPGAAKLAEATAAEARSVFG